MAFSFRKPQPLKENKNVFLYSTFFLFSRVHSISIVFFLKILDNTGELCFVCFSPERERKDLKIKADQVFPMAIFCFRCFPESVRKKEKLDNKKNDRKDGDATREGLEKRLKRPIVRMRKKRGSRNLTIDKIRPKKEKEF